MTDRRELASVVLACSDKRACPTRTIAKRAKLAMERKKQVAFRIYMCPCCGKYHIAHRVYH